MCPICYRVLTQVSFNIAVIGNNKSELVKIGFIKETDKINDIAIKAIRESTHHHQTSKIRKMCIFGSFQVSSMNFTVKEAFDEWEKVFTPGNEILCWLFV